MNISDALNELRDQKYALDQSSIVAATDRHGLITYANDKFCEISGYSREELIGINHRILCSGFHSKDFFQDLWATIQAGQVWRGEICNLAKSKKRYWVNTTIVPFIGPDGLPYQFLAIRYDISALKEAEQTILAQQGQLAAASKLSALGELSACISHEINNPLGVILGRCEMLREMIDSGETNQQAFRKIAETIETTGRRIEKIVKSIRTFTYGHESELMQASRLDELLQTSLDLVSQRFKDHGIDLRIKVPTEKIIFDCRPTQILQILVNLLNNAHDAVFKGQEKWCELEVQATSQTMKILVTDSGKGIPSHVVKRLFSPFFTTKEINFGTGLGLSISQSLAQKHQGTLIYDQNCPNTRFVLTVPTKQPSAIQRSP